MAATTPNKIRYTQVTSANASEGKTSRKEYEDRKAGKSWWAPITIVAALATGIGAALAHHFMNVSLNGEVVASIGISQAWITRFATGLAFLVKTALTLAVGVVFVQRQWSRLRGQTFTVADIDIITGVLQNPLSFVRSIVWCRHPILLSLALVSWAIPFAAIVAPGSLSIDAVRIRNTTMSKVPQPEYYSSNYGNYMRGPSGYGFVDTDQSLQRLAFLAAAAAQPAQLHAQYPNQTYHLQFAGPAVKCASANDSVVERFSIEFGTSGGPQDYAQNLTFASWVGGNEGALNSTWPGGNEIAGSESVDYQTLDFLSTDAARIFVMTTSGDWNATVYGPGPIELYNPSGNVYYTRLNVTECLLFNATYEVDFGFRFPAQTINTTISSWHNPVAVASSASVGFGADPLANSTAAVVASYSSMMNAYGKLLVGMAYFYLDIQQTKYTSWDILNIDWSRSETVERGLEQLFQNFTLSLLSNDSFIKDSATADLIPVTVETWPLKYIYEPLDLLLAYGLSILLSAIAAIIGLHAFFVNHGSYQNTFSTFFRMMKDSELQALVAANDSGVDPLPKQLGSAKIRMSGED